MTPIPYTTRRGDSQFKPRMDDEHELNDILYDGTKGFCLACGEEADGVEPDARRYECESCGAAKVFGYSELLLMNLIDLKQP